MKLTKPRADFGWETPYDLYRELRTRLGTGTLFFSQQDAAGGTCYVFDWTFTADGKPLGGRIWLTERDLMVHPVVRLAEEHARRLRASAENAMRGHRQPELSRAKSRNH
jgi:hypothetical protein